MSFTEKKYCFFLTSDKIQNSLLKYLFHTEQNFTDM